MDAMSLFDPSAELTEQVHQLLGHCPDGLSEYELLRSLREGHCSHIPNLPLSDHLVLFRSHFLLFNALYQLRDQLNQTRQAHLQIDPLRILLLPYSEGEQALSHSDSLRSYYLDLTNLRDTSEQEVERLLSSFWTRMHGGEEKRAALELFELADSNQPISAAVVKLRYRQLVAQHHPDRGGSTERIQSINLAFEILQRYYQ